MRAFRSGEGLVVYGVVCLVDVERVRADWIAVVTKTTITYVVSGEYRSYVWKGVLGVCGPVDSFD